MPLIKKHFFRPNDQKFINQLLKIRVFRNGDSSYKGHIFKFRKNNFRDFPELLEAIAKEMQESIFLHIGGITFLYTLTGIDVTSVDDLVDGEDYVAACLTESFKYVLYPVQSRTVLSQASTSLIRSRSLSSLRCRSPSACSFTSLEYRGPGTQTFRPRYITIIQGVGEPPRKVFRVHLTNSNATHLQMVMDRINHQATFDDGMPLDRVFRENCTEVRCLEDFFDNIYVFFAFPKCRLGWDMFDLSDCEDDKVAALNEVLSENIEWRNHLPTSVSSEYRIQGFIAGSVFTNIHECVERSTQRRYAIKIVKRIKNNAFSESIIKPKLNEMNLLSELHHPNILCIFFTEETPDALYSVMEYCDGGDLRHAISMNTIKHEEYLPLMENLASALAYLHLRGIAHRDVCPTNMLLKIANNHRKLVLTDFNQATRIEDPLYDIGGFLLYMAPEMLARTGYGLKADIWSAGVTLYLMATNELPFEEKDIDKCARRILRQRVDYGIDRWGGVDDSVKILTDFMLCRDTVHRLSAGEVLAYIANVRDGHVHQYEFDRYCDVEIEARRRRRRGRHSTRNDIDRRRRMY